MTDKVGPLPVQDVRLVRLRRDVPVRPGGPDASRCTRSFLFLPAEAPFGDPRLLRADHGARAGAQVVRRRRRARALERRVAQRGPRHLVRVGVRAGARRRRSTSGRLLRAADARSLRPGDQLRARSGPWPRRSTAPTTSRRCSAPTSTTAARSSCSPCARWSATRRSRRSSASGRERYGGGSASTADFIALASQDRRTRPRGLPQRLAVRHEDPADARPPRLDRRPGRPAGGQGRRSRPPLARAWS